MKRLCILIIILFNTGMIFAESSSLDEDRTSMIGLSMGYTFSGFREETIADVNRYLNTIVFSIHGVVEKGPFMHSHNAGFFSGQSDLLVEYPLYQFEEESHNYTVKDTYSRVFFEYALSRELWGNAVFPGYLGGAIRGDLYLIETLVNPLYISLTAIASLNLYLSQKWIIDNKKTLALSVSFPVLGYAIRPQYIGLFAWPLEFGVTSLHNYWACFGSIKYYYRLNPFVSLFSDIGFEISGIDFSKIRRDAGVQIKLGAVYMY